MGRIVVTEFVSLDGIMEDPGGGGFEHVGLPRPNRLLNDRARRATPGPLARAGCCFLTGEIRWGYAVTSVPCGAWLGISSSLSPVRRAWANPSPTNTAMTAASAKAAMAHHRAISAMRLNP